MLYLIAQILPHFQSAEEKNRLLRAVAGTGLDSLSSLRAKWDKLELVIESHQLMIKEQVKKKRNSQIFYKSSLLQYFILNLIIPLSDKSYFLPQFFVHLPQIFFCSDFCCLTVCPLGGIDAE